MKFEQCMYGGGDSCTRQGGDGCTIHKSNDLHPFTHTDELQYIAKSNPADTGTVHVLPVLEYDILEESVINKSLFSGSEIISKALYHFDLETPSGVTRLLELLPVLSDDIIKEVYQEIWPTYPVEQSKIFNLRMARSEIKGYLLDYLNQHDIQDPGQERPRQIDSAIPTEVGE